MRHIVFLVVATQSLTLTCRLLAGDTPASGDEFTKVKSEYADVLALQGTAKGEIRGRSDGGEWRILLQQRSRHDGSLCHATGKHG